MTKEDRDEYKKFDEDEAIKETRRRIVIDMRHRNAMAVELRKTE